MSMLKIEKGVPLPIQYRGRPAKFPIPHMEIGDSICVAADDYKSKESAQNSLVTSARRHKAKHPDFYYTTSIQVESGVTVARLWRIENPKSK